MENQTEETSHLDKTVIESIEKDKQVLPGESVMVTETLKTKKVIRVKLDRDGSPKPVEEKIIEPPQQIERIVAVHLPQEEEQKEKPDTTKVSKESCLDFFKSIITREKEEAKNEEEIPKPKSEAVLQSSELINDFPAPEIFLKQSQIVSELKHAKRQEEEVPPKQELLATPPDTISRVQESYREETSSFSKSETIEKKTQSVYKDSEKTLNVILPPQEEFNLKPEPPPEMGFAPKVEKTKVYEDVSQKVKKLEEFHKAGSPIDPPSGGVRLLPIIHPKPTEPPAKQEIKIEKERVIETLPPLSWLTDEPFSKEDKEVFQSTQSICKEEKKTEKWISPAHPEPLPTFAPTQSTLHVQRDFRPTSPRPSAEGVAMEKLWTSKKAYEDYQPSTEFLDTPKPSGIYRPSSSLEPMRAASPRPSAEGVAMEKLWASSRTVETLRPASSLGFTNRCTSPRPSQEGIAMDKIWAHKHKESSLNTSWPPPKPKEEEPVVFMNSQTEPRVWPPEHTSYENETTLKRSEMKSHETTTKHFREINYPKGPEVKTFHPSTPVTHYVAESRLIRQTQSMDRQLKYTSESSSTMQQRYWYEDTFSKVQKPEPVHGLQAPNLVKKFTDSGASAFHSTQQMKIESGPPPEFGHAPPPQTAPSYMKPIETGTYKAPFRESPSTVRIIPQPTKIMPVKREMKRSNSLELRSFERFPDLEPFPFKPDPPRPKPAKCPPPPTPTKFVKCHFAESDYESDYDSRISVKWRPYESDSEDCRYRKVKPPSTNYQSRRPQSTGPEPLPPSKFENPPELIGPSRPIVDTVSSKMFSSTKKEFHRSLSDSKETKKKFIKVKTISPPKMKPGSPPEFVQCSKFKPEPPKAKPMKLTKPPDSGYMADTDEPFAFKQKSECSTVRELFTKQMTSESYSTHSQMVKSVRKRQNVFV